MVGKFIVFEGLDGSGITTQSTLLRNFLLKKGKNAVLTKEPTDGLVGGILKSALKKEWKTDPMTLQLLFTADRSHHTIKEIEPALRTNKIVICDRYILSTLAFGSLDVSVNILKQLNVNFRKPNMTIIMDTQPKICMERIKKARPHVELFEEEHKLVNIRNNFMALKKFFPDTYMVDGNRGVEEIMKDVQNLVKKAHII